MNENYIDVNGARTRYASAGESGPALILLHGLGASLESWLLNVDALGEHFRVYAPDIIYFGKSAKPAHVPTHLDFVQFIFGFMDAVGIGRATLVGNSMGGLLAAKMAIVDPERVENLVLVAPAGFGRDIAWWIRLRSVINVRPRGTPSPRMIQLGLRQVFHDPRRVPNELVDAILALHDEPGLQEAYRRVIRVGVDWRGLKPAVLREVRDAAESIRTPTLIVWGKQDKVLPIHHLAAAHAKIPQARVHIFEQCGHAPQIEMANEFNAIVLDFMREVKSE
jgi:pimeloyl-ACP methyl ester carboxylesterase